MEQIIKITIKYRQRPMLINNGSRSGIPNVESRVNRREAAVFQNWTRSEERQLQEAEGCDRLDLIYQKEPREIQDKLNKLLIRYNAVMEYNKDTQLFEVDLLIPFVDDSQKQDFIRQFLQIRRLKSRLLDAAPKERTQLQDIEWIGEYKQVRKFSFNGGHHSDVAGNVQPSSIEGDMWIDSQARGNSNQYQTLQINTDDDLLQERLRSNTGAFNNIISSMNEDNKITMIDFSQLQDVIARRLKKAVKTIKKKKGLQVEEALYPVDGGNDNSLANVEAVQPEVVIIQEEPKVNSFKQSSIIDHIYNTPSMSNSDRFSDLKPLSNSQYIKQQFEAQPLFGNRIGNSQESKYEPQHSYDEHSFYQSSNPFIKIAQQPQEDQYEPIFIQPPPPVQNNRIKQTKAISFQDFSLKYQSIKYEQQAKNKAMPKTFGSVVGKSAKYRQGAVRGGRFK